MRTITPSKAGNDNQFNRNDFAKARVPHSMIDELLRLGGNQGFRQVSIPDRKISGMERPLGGQTIKSDVDTRKKALKRQMSRWAIKGKLPGMGGKEHRSFFRTWVTAVQK